MLKTHLEPLKLHTHFNNITITLHGNHKQHTVDILLVTNLFIVIIFIINKILISFGGLKKLLPTANSL